MPTKTERIGLRATEQQRRLLEAASDVEGTTITEFVLSHATRAAEEVLADRRVFFAGEEAWAAFTRALDAPPKDVRGLRDLLKYETVLDQH